MEIKEKKITWKDCFAEDREWEKEKNEENREKHRVLHSKSHLEVEKTQNVLSYQHTCLVRRCQHQRVFEEEKEKEKKRLKR